MTPDRFNAALFAFLLALLIIWGATAWANEPKRYSLGLMGEPAATNDWIEFEQIDAHSVLIRYHNRKSPASGSGVSDPVFDMPFTHGGLDVIVNLRLNMHGTNGEEIRIEAADPDTWTICPASQLALDGETVTMRANSAGFGCGLM